jgi:REP element-mobilizing transposase RayT
MHKTKKRAAMSHSFTNLLYHLVFSTKNREPWLDGEVGRQVHTVLAGRVHDEGGIALAVNGIADHVHLLVKLRQDRPLSEVLRDLKARSSFWVHKNLPGLEQFAWQIGYGAFTVSQSQLQRVRRYIQNQEEHHRRRPYQDEFRQLLRHHGIEFTEEDLWD